MTIIFDGGSTGLQAGEKARIRFGASAPEDNSPAVHQSSSIMAYEIRRKQLKFQSGTGLAMAPPDVSFPLRRGGFSG
jgi:hypothetical protein